MIPKIIHMIWLGKMEDIVQDSVNAYKNMNPDHEVILHRNIKDLSPNYRDAYNYFCRPKTCPNINQYPDKFLKGMRIWASDMLRYSLLEKYGGWYVDIKTTPLRPLSELYDYYDLSKLLITFYYYGWVDNDILAVTPNWGGWKHMVNYIDSIPKEDKILAYATFCPWAMRYLRQTIPEQTTVGYIEHFAQALQTSEPYIVRKKDKYDMLRQILNYNRNHKTGSIITVKPKMSVEAQKILSKFNENKHKNKQQSS